MLSVRVSQDVAGLFDYHVLKTPHVPKQGMPFSLAYRIAVSVLSIFLYGLPGATQIAEYSAIIAISMFAVETQSALTSCLSRLFECRIAAFVAR